MPTAIRLQGDTSTVTLTLSSGTFAGGASTVTAGAVSGVATFSNLVINTAGTYTLAAGDGSLAAATSASFTISSATKLAFVQQPTGARPAPRSALPVTVAVDDVNGNTVAGDTSTVTLTLSSGTFAGGTNTATASTVGGVATFSSLVINTAGPYTLAASDSSLTAATSSSFTIARLRLQAGVRPAANGRRGRREISPPSPWRSRIPTATPSRPTRPR